ncbi:MAG: hypothetical protein ACYCUY_08465 [Acidithiobacillus sp.]
MDGQQPVTLRAAPFRTYYPLRLRLRRPFQGLLWKWRHGSKHWRPAPLTRVRAWRRSLLVLAASHARH